MRRHALAILAVISLVGLAPLLCGYIANFGAAFVRRTEHRYLSVAANGGCLGVVWGQGAPVFPDKPVTIDDVQVYTSFYWGLPPAWYALSRLRARATNDPGYVIIFPLWCLILPCTIAPTLWLRRHRRRTARGFAVEPAAQPITK